MKMVEAAMNGVASNISRPFRGCCGNLGIVCFRVNDMGRCAGFLGKRTVLLTESIVASRRGMKHRTLKKLLLPKTLMTLPTATTTWQTSLQWQPTPDQHTKFAQLYDAILKGNQQLNLTRLTAPDEFWEKHLWDAIAGLLPLQNHCSELTGKAIDVGTGCGIPGLPLALLHPQLQVTLLDSVQKKVRFLQDMVQALGWHQVGAIASRVETIGHNSQHREQYQIALVRAVAAPAVCVEYVLPLLTIGGVAVLYQGQWSNDDSDAIQPALQTLGGELLDVVGRTTPLTQCQRHWVYLRKTRATSERYPRAVGIPSKRPLA